MLALSADQSPLLLHEIKTIQAGYLLMETLLTASPAMAKYWGCGELPYARLGVCRLLKLFQIELVITSGLNILNAFQDTV
jgi:hypothetical protein